MGSIADKARMQAWAKNAADEVGYAIKPEGWTIETLDMKAPPVEGSKPATD